MQSLQPGLTATTGEENIMSIFDVGRIVVKIAGRDAGKKAVVVEQLDNTYVLIDGATRRRKVNIRHLEPLDTVLELSAGAAHEEVERVLAALPLLVRNTKSKNTPVRMARKGRALKSTETSGKKTIKTQKQSI